MCNFNYLCLSFLILLLVGIPWNGLANESYTIQPAQFSVNSAQEREIKFPPYASYGCCIEYYDHRHANRTSRIVMTNFNERLFEMQDELINALRLATGQISGTTREQTAAQHTLADQQDDRATVKAIETARMNAMQETISGPSSCAIITGSTGGTTSYRADEFKQDLSVQVNSWSQGSPEVPSSLGSSQAALALLRSHCSNFANATSIESGLCEIEGKIPNGDTDVANSIFFQSDQVGYRLDQERIDAAKAFMLTAIDPTPIKPVSDAQAKTPQGKILATKRNTSIARASVANETLSFLTSQRVPNSNQNTIDWAHGHAEGMSGLEGVDFSSGVSHKDWLRLHSQHFLLNPDWIKDSDTSIATAQKATKNVLAVIAYQGFETYKLLERIATNLAVQTALLNEQSRSNQP